ncbi:iron-siderophore ABC transporter substrate-binding protein [Gordonia sp. UBA5067]|uniref:ABC transporter substrate-binding protein n=1 Tax=Gordonia sp. UBA5067 TaxID=1946575 RepID=UPI0025BFAB3B|nr:iron-siderophore ABC transporter substrate-binding protein [Gordonia sp. UBA5067]
MRLAARITTALTGGLLIIGLAGCDTVRPAPPVDGRPYVDADHRTVAIPANPRRVVTLAEGALDSALALGITPVGSTAGRGQLGIPGYLTTATSIPIVASTRSPNLGQILKLRPDLIVVDDTTGSRNSIDDLAKIAPTVFVAKYAHGWETYFAAMAAVLNRPDQHRHAMTEINGKIAVAAGLVATAPGPKSPTASVVRWSSEGPTIVGGNSLSTWVLNRVGMQRPPAQQQVDSANRAGQKVSMENLDQIDADYIFFGVLGSTGQAREELDVARAKPGFSGLRATRSGHVFPVDGTPWTSGTGPLGVEAILRDITAAFD